MANRAYLLNVPTLTGDPYLLQERLSCGPEADYAEIAEVSNRISLPWICCFRGAELTEVHVPLEYWEGRTGPDELIVGLPCIDVATAQKNMQASLGIFQQMAGDDTVGRGYWVRACEGLEELPLPYLAMNPIEVLFLWDIAEVPDLFAACFKPQPPSLETLKSWSGFHDGFAPFNAEDFYSRPLAELDHVARLDSSRALDAGYLRDHYFWHRSKPREQEAPQVGAADTTPRQSTGESAAARKRPWWRLW